MLQPKVFIAVGALVAVGGAVAYTYTRKDPHLKKPGDQLATTGTTPVIKATDVDEVDITDVGKPKLVLKKDAGTWKLTEPVADTADQKNVEAALSTLEKMKFKSIVAESKESWPKLQIDDKQVLTVVLSGGGKPITTLHIGKSGTVRVNDEERVWTVTDLNRFAIAREVKMWRDRTLIRFEKDDVDRFELGLGAAKVVLHREPAPKPADDDPKKPHPFVPDKWTITEGQDVIGGPLDESMPSNLLLIFTRLDASDFGDGATDASAGLTTPRATWTAVMKDGSKRDLSLGNEDPNGTEVLVKTSTSPRIYKLRNTSVDMLLKPPLQWRDKTLSKLAPADVVKVHVEKGNAKATFQRIDDKTWKTLDGPSDLGEIDPLKVTGLVAAFANLHAAAIVDAPDPAKTGLDKPTAVVTVWKKDGTQVEITLGAEVDKAYFSKVNGRSEVFQLAEVNAMRILKAPADMKKIALPPGTMPGGDPHGMPPGMPPGHP
jgi:hypothetical protein